MTNRPILLAAGILGLLAPGIAAAAGGSPEGYWRTKGFIIEISRCGSNYCGELVGLNKNKRADGDRLDRRNKDPNQRSRPLCGIELFWDFRPAADEAGKWEGGVIYNPDDGKTYDAEAKMLNPDTLKVRGYVGVTLLGRNLILVRESDPHPSCRANTASADAR